MTKENIIKGIMSLAIVSLIIGLTFFIFKKDNVGDKNEGGSLDLDLNSEIVSSNAKESARNFMLRNGTIGDLAGLEEDDIVNLNFPTNSNMRRMSFEAVKEAIIPDSPLIDGNEDNAIDNDLSQFPVYYTIENLKVNEPTPLYKLPVEHNGIGLVEYDATKVDVSFDSVQTTFYWPTDLGSDGVITEEVSSDSFENITVTMVNSGGKWFIYDVEDSEYTLNVRMSTWSGRGNYDVSVEQEVVRKYVLENMLRQ